VTSVFSLAGTGLGMIFCTLPEQADVFSVFLLFSYFLKFAPMGGCPLPEREVSSLLPPSLPPSAAKKNFATTFKGVEKYVLLTGQKVI
jgi:hypothetical protein